MTNHKTREYRIRAHANGNKPWNQIISKPYRTELAQKILTNIFNEQQCNMVLITKDTQKK
jgi:hypothetical protein